MASPLCSANDSEHESDQSSGDMVSDLCFYGGDEGSGDDFEGGECCSAYQGPQAYMYEPAAEREEGCTTDQSAAGDTDSPQAPEPPYTRTLNLYIN